MTKRGAVSAVWKFISKNISKNNQDSVFCFIPASSAFVLDFDCSQRLWQLLTHKIICYSTVTGVSPPMTE